VPRRLMCAAVAAAVTIALAGCGSAPKSAAADGLDARTVTLGELEVKITPTRVDATGATFDIAFDTHTGAPDIDVAANTTLAVNGTTWTAATWTGDGPGDDHHRAGTLRFTATGPATGSARLAIDGLAGPVEATWQLSAP